MPLTVSPKKLPNDIDVLELTGKITMGNDCLQLQWRAEGLVAENRKKLVFDMSAISHVDSTGIGIIVMIAGKTKQTGGELRLAGCQEHVAHVLRLTSIDKIVHLYPSVSEAAEGF